jgi:hypothetical protein
MLTKEKNTLNHFGVIGRYKQINELSRRVKMVLFMGRKLA